MRRAASLAYRDAGTRLSKQICRQATRQPHGLLLSGNAQGFISRSRHLPSILHNVGRNRQLATSTYEEPTIYALSSAPGRAAIAVIRISGSACRAIYHAICPNRPIPKPRVAAVRTLHAPWEEPRSETILDSSALVLYFPGPATATGEDILELHVHGGPAIVKAVLGAISKCGGGIRYAEPGEFTRRAFMNNRMDLTQVEALGDTLAADTEQQRLLSIRGTTGTLSEHYEAWRQQLLYARGELEALIDFSEDQHFDESPAELCASVAQQVQTLKRALSIHSTNAVKGELLRHGISVSLLGAPNAGKSSLLNRIVGREAAIVSNEAGTTRDVVEIGLDLGGYFCRFGDTAGLRQVLTNTTDTSRSPNAIEQEGMRRAKARAAESDVVVIVLSLEVHPNTHEVDIHFDEEVCTFAQNLIGQKDNVLVVINKIDLLPPNNAILENLHKKVQDCFPGLSRQRVHAISCTGSGSPGQNSKLTTHPSTGSDGGVQLFLREGLIRHFRELTTALSGGGGGGESDSSIWQESLGASERHRVLLDACISHLEAFLAEVVPSSDVAGSEETDIVVAAEHLRSAADCLAKITGKGEAGDVEEVLGVVFEKFCVGK